jgi:hypothetical protein
MAKRRSKQDVGAKQDAPPFDYSQAERSEIEAAARAVLPDGKPLPNEVREALVQAARIFRANIKKRPWPKERRDYQKIVQLSELLHQAVSVMVEKRADWWTIFGAPERAKGIRRNLEHRLKGVLEIKLAAQFVLDLKMDHRPARVFQSFVLAVWTRLGGKLQSSRHPKTGEPRGPCIRFFQAVTNPVMGASAPSLESLPAIIRREKRALEESAARKAAAAPPKRLMGIRDSAPPTNTH